MIATETFRQPETLTPIQLSHTGSDPANGPTYPFLKQEEDHPDNSYRSYKHDEYEQRSEIFTHDVETHGQLLALVSLLVSMGTEPDAATEHNLTGLLMNL